MVVNEHISSSECSSEEMPHRNLMSIMVTNVDTNEDRMTELEKKVNMHMKAIEESYYEAASFKNHIESHDAAKSSHTHTVKNIDKGKTCKKVNHNFWPKLHHYLFSSCGR